MLKWWWCHTISLPTLGCNPKRHVKMSWMSLVVNLKDAEADAVQVMYHIIFPSFMKLSMLFGQVNWVVEVSRFHRLYWHVLTTCQHVGSVIDCLLFFPKWAACKLCVASLWVGKAVICCKICLHVRPLSFQNQQCRACNFAAAKLIPRIQSFNRQAAKISPWWFWTKLWWHWFVYIRI